VIAEPVDEGGVALENVLRTDVDAQLTALAPIDHDLEWAE
jgi:hypothetical protein